MLSYSFVAKIEILLHSQNLWLIEEQLAINAMNIFDEL